MQNIRQARKVPDFSGQRGMKATRPKSKARTYIDKHMLEIARTSRNAIDFPPNADHGLDDSTVTGRIPGVGRVETFESNGKRVEEIVRQNGATIP